MKFGLLLVTAMASGWMSLTQVAHGAETATSTNSGVMDESLRLKLRELNKKHEVNTDITNPEMAAQAGSTSQYSLKFNVSYYGAPIDRPFSKEGPNPDNSPIDPSTTLSGSLSLLYRLDKRSAISVGSGLTALTPFHGVKRVDTKNPYAGIDYNYKIGNWQMRSSVSVSATTQENYTKRGQNASASLGQNFAYKFPETKISVGSNNSLSFYNYNREYLPKDGSTSSYYLGIYPFAEYGINDKLSLKTSVSVSFYNPRSTKNQWELQHRFPNQWLGMGYSYSRTVYIYPYVSFYPTRFNWETTTVAFSTIFSLL